MFGIVITTRRKIEERIRVERLDVARFCQRLALPRGGELEGDYGRGRVAAAEDVRKYGDDLRANLFRPI